MIEGKPTTPRPGKEKDHTADANALDEVSTPAPGTENGLNSKQIKAILFDQLKLCHSTVPKHPYKLARLVHHNFSTTKRWYVDFCAWNVKTERLERRRLFEPLNRKKYSQAERIDIGREMVRIVNGQLLSGMVLGKDELNTQPIATVKNMTVSEALLHFKDEKQLNGLRFSYYRSFSTLANSWLAWREHIHMSDFALKELTEDDMHQYFQWLKTHQQIANKTHNKYRSDFNIFIRWVMKRYPTTLKKNPVENIPVLKTVARKHAAFSNEQMKSILTKCQEKGYTQLWLFIHFVYYTLARPGELRQLKVRHIDLEQNRLFIPGTISKNRMDEWVTLAPPLVKAIKKSGVLKADPEHFIFGKRQRPGPAMIHKSSVWERNVKVLQALKLTDRPYDVYSYKHSGAISLYRATKDIKLVMRQCRHQGIEQTNVYLRDLGELDDNQALQAWQGFEG